MTDDAKLLEIANAFVMRHMGNEISGNTTVRLLNVLRDVQQRVAREATEVCRRRAAYYRAHAEDASDTRTYGPAARAAACEEDAGAISKAFDLDPKPTAEGE